MADDRHDHFGEDGSERPGKRLVVDWTRVVSGLDGLDPAADYEIHVRREVIPIILVPGLFGTRLETASGAPLWEPATSLLPEGANAQRVAAAYLRLGGLWSSPGDRARLFARGVRVTDGDAERGWRSLCADSYGDCLRRLKRWPWRASIQLCFQLPVHGFGYDWTADLLRSGERLARYVEETVSRYSAQGQPCKRVFLVAHGVGGLVAQAACAQHGAGPQVLGLFCAGVPVHGTPAAYHALKAGFRRGEGPEGMAADLLGHTGQHVSALAESMPALLQLLPGPRYRDAQGKQRWLRFEGPDSAPVAAFSGLDIGQGAGRYWGLPTTEHHPGQTELMQDWQHDNCYLALGQDLATADRAAFRVSPRGRKKKFGRLTLVPVRKVDGEILTERGENIVAHDVFGDGSYRASLTGPDNVTLEVALQPPDGRGDGVVPLEAARVDAVEGQGSDRLPRARAFAGAEHYALLRHEPVLDYLVQAVEQACLDHMVLQVAA